jgi:putative ABC transport system permease protein
LRWSWRDLKRRWIQLTITALVIALGTGLFAGLSSVSRWREMSNDASFEVTRFHDLHAHLGAGNFAGAGELTEAATADGGGEFAAVEERLVVPTQVQVTADDGELVIVPGQLVGQNLSEGDPEVDRPYTAVGRPLTADDEGEDVALMERNFGKLYGLGEGGKVVLTGGQELQFTGQAMSPEYFIVVTEEAGLLAEANFGVVFTSPRRPSGLRAEDGERPGGEVAAGEDPERAASALRERLAPVGATVELREDEDAYRILTEDAKGDQQTYTVMAGAILAGAVFAAFNITSRMVEAQRREFGIAMALGVAPWRIGLRPLLVGAQIALLGVVFGIGVGLLIGWAMGELLRSFLVIPVITTPFQWGIFAAVAALGLVAPMVAIAYPVWRAVRVPPIQAIRTGHVAVRTPGLARLAGRIPVPGDTFLRMPIRNLLRAPRRALLTGAGIAAIIAVLAGLLAYIDLCRRPDRAEAETAAQNPTGSKSTSTASMPWIPLRPGRY